MLQDGRPVKFKDPKFKHEIFVRIYMKHSYFSNYFINFFCFIIELFVVCQDLLPARASEQGNVIGSVRLYIYICVYKKKL